MLRHEKVAAAVAQFPKVFGLRTFPGSRVRISEGASFVTRDGGVQLVVQIEGDDLVWRDLTRGTPAEIRRYMVRLP